MDPEASSAEEEGQDPQPVTVMTQKVVKYGKQVWVPTQKEENGTVWFLLQKWDRSLVRFVHGKGLDLRAKKKDAGDARVSLDNMYFDNLLCARQSAFNEAVAARLQEESSEENVGKKQSKNAKKKQKEFKATSKHQMYAPHNVSINLPSEKDGSKLTCRCLFEGLGSRGVWLELTSEVLKHVQHGMKSSEIKERKRAPKRKRAAKS